MGRLDGRVAILTGAGRGIGAATAAKLAAEGAAVAVTDMDIGPAEETAEAIRSAGGKALAVAVDVTQKEHVEAAASKAAESLALLLRTHQNDVRTVHDGPTALETARAFQPDIIFLDIGLPGMDGYEVARRIRDDKAIQQPLLVALTGYGREEDRQRAAQAGFDHFLVKPTPPKVLTDIALQLRPSG